MHFSSIHAYAGILIAGSALAGCASDRNIELADPSGTTESGDSVRFENDGTITLAPGEAREIAVTTSPPARVDVRFALLGDALDASLERSVVRASDEGRAEVLLHAPNQSTTFRIRATALDPHGQPVQSAETGVAVSDQGFGTLRVLPSYSGKRPIKGWTASVIARASCQDIASTLPAVPDGALTANGPSDQPLFVKGAPVGPSLAVAVRSSKYMWGCTDIANLKPDTTLDVKIMVVDKPIDLAATNLDLALEYAPDPAGYGAILDAGRGLLHDAFIPSGTKEAELVLDAMAAASSDAAAFQAERAASGWDAIATAHWSMLSAPLSDRLETWTTSGLGLGTHTVTANIKATAGQAGTATFSALRLDGIDAAAAGIPKQTLFAWTADPNDSLSLNGTLSWQPSRFLGAVAYAGAKQDYPAAATMSDALAGAADCAGLGNELGGYGMCNDACMAALCKDALDARWTAALTASMASGKLGEIAITAAGPADITDTAEPLGFYGNWVGSVSVGALTVGVKGKISGETPVGMGPP